MSTKAWISPDKADQILALKGHRTIADVAAACEVSPRTVQRIWARGDADCRYHPWSIVSDPNDRAMIRTAWRAETAPAQMDGSDMDRYEILLILRHHSPAEVAAVLADAGLGAS